MTTSESGEYPLVREFANALHGRSGLVDELAWVEEPERADMTSLGVDGPLNIVAIVAWFRERLEK